MKELLERHLKQEIVVYGNQANQGILDAVSDDYFALNDFEDYFYYPLSSIVEIRKDYRNNLHIITIGSIVDALDSIESETSDIKSYI